MVSRALLGVALLTLFSVARSEVLVELGANVVQEQYSDSETIIVQKRWREKFALGVGYMGSHCMDNAVNGVKCNWRVPASLMLGGERIFRWNRWAFAFGIYYVGETSRISSTHLNARSSLEFNVTEKLAVKLAHLSNGGLGPETTECNTRGGCVTNDFNLGINTLSLVWEF